MCGNENCQFADAISIQEKGFDGLSLLEIYEFSLFEERFGKHPEISVDVEAQFVDVLFPLRKICWGCARGSIAEAMGWHFDYLNFGFPLADHEDLDFLEVFRFMGQEWMDLLLWNMQKSFIELSNNDEEVKLFERYIADGISPQSVRAIAEWHRYKSNHSIAVDVLNKILDAGYRDNSDLEMITKNCLEEALSWGRSIPSKSTLIKMSTNSDGFDEYSDLLWNLYEGLSNGPSETDVENLWRTGLEIEELKELGHLLFDDALMSFIYSEDGSFLEIYSDLDGNYFDIAERNLYVAFASTLQSIREVGVELSRANVAKYWGMSALMILFVIDNGIRDADHLRIARYVRSSSELHGWISAGQEDIPLDEVQLWIKSGFVATSAMEWKIAGFDAVSAAKWKVSIDNPVVARRRLEAGIQAP
jgi:hypothetical protein